MTKYKDYVSDSIGEEYLYSSFDDFSLDPDGSFIDNSNFFLTEKNVINDNYGGYYDKYGFFCPGRNWNDDYNCYNDEIVDCHPQYLDCATLIEQLEDEYDQYYNVISLSSSENYIDI